MDIISEILETDRLAEEQLENARNKRTELIAECEAQISRIKEQAVQEAEKYKSHKLKASEDDKGSISGELLADEKNELDALEKLYEKNHAIWEQDIFSAVTGGGQTNA